MGLAPDIPSRTESTSLEWVTSFWPSRKGTQPVPHRWTSTASEGAYCLSSTPSWPARWSRTRCRAASTCSKRDGRHHRVGDDKAVSSTQPNYRPGRGEPKDTLPPGPPSTTVLGNLTPSQPFPFSHGPTFSSPPFRAVYLFAAMQPPDKQIALILEHLEKGPSVAEKVIRVFQDPEANAPIWVTRIGGPKWHLNGSQSDRLSHLGGPKGAGGRRHGTPRTGVGGSG